MSADKRNLWIISIALAALTLAVFLPVTGFDWAEYDDVQYIRDNPEVAKGLTLAGIKWAFAAPHFNYWQPLTFVSHMIDCQLFGLNPRAHHVVNLLFHLVNTVLVFWLLHRATGSVGRSACVAALFAVHPLHVEPVAWLAERKGLLSTFFCLLSLIYYVRYVKTRSWSSYALVSLFFVLACMSKPIAVTLPALFLLMDLWPLNRFAPGKVFPIARQVVIEKIPLFVIAIAVALVTVWASHQIGGYVGSTTMPLGYRVWRVPVAYSTYLAKTFWPSGLNILYPLPSQWYAGRVFKAALVIFVISIIALLQLRKKPYFAFGWLWFLVGLLPGIGLVAAGGQQLIADRFAYLPILGVLIIGVWLVADIFGSKPAGRPLPLQILGATAVILCAWISYVQLPVWRDQKTLWAQAIQLNEHHPNNNADTYAEMGLAMLNQGHPVQASNYLAKSLALFPNFPRVQGHYARAMLNLTNYPAAVHYAEQALAAKPNDFIVQHVLGKAYLGLGNPEAAFPHFSNSLALYPQFFPEHGEIAVVMAAKGREEDGLALLRQGMKIDPRSAEPHFRLASIMEMKGNFREAAMHYREGLRLDPKSTVALNNLAWLLATNPDATVRNGKEAVGLGEKACELAQWKEPVLMGTLAAAYAEAGDFQKAVETGQRARDLARSLGQFELAARNEELLTSYRARNPWREGQRTQSSEP